MSGIGGREPVIEKSIQALHVGNIVMSPCIVQMGALNYGISVDGILGMDFLSNMGTVINLHSFVVVQAT